MSVLAKLCIYLPDRPGSLAEFASTIGHAGGIACRSEVISRGLAVAKIGPLSFDVLESLGGHTPGLVFFLNQEFGLLFTSDFLLNVKSLRPEDKEHLGIYRYLLTSPNRDSRVYKEETTAHKEMMLAMGRDLTARGRTAYIFPGHGDYYAVGELIEKC